MRVPRIDEVIRPVANPHFSATDRKQYAHSARLENYVKLADKISARLNPRFFYRVSITRPISFHRPNGARSIQARPSYSGPMGRAVVNWTSISSSRDYMAIGLALIARMNSFELSWERGLGDWYLADTEIERYSFSLHMRITVVEDFQRVYHRLDEQFRRDG